MGQLGIHGMVAARDAELQLMVDYFAELPARIEKMTGAQLFKAARLLGWLNANAAKGCASRYNERGNYIIYTTKTAAVDCIIGELLRRGNDDSECRLSVEEDGRGGWFIVYFDGLNGEQVSFHHYGSEDIRSQLAELAEVGACWTGNLHGYLGEQLGARLEVAHDKVTEARSRADRVCNEYLELHYSGLVYMLEGQIHTACLETARKKAAAAREKFRKYVTVCREIRQGTNYTLGLYKRELAKKKTAKARAKVQQEIDNRIRWAVDDRREATIDYLRVLDHLAALEQLAALHIECCYSVGRPFEVRPEWSSLEVVQRRAEWVSSCVLNLRDVVGQDLVANLPAVKEWKRRRAIYEGLLDRARAQIAELMTLCRE